MQIYSILYSLTHSSVRNFGQRKLTETREQLDTVWIDILWTISRHFLLNVLPVGVNIYSTLLNIVPKPGVVQVKVMFKCIAECREVITTGAFDKHRASSKAERPA